MKNLIYIGLFGLFIIGCTTSKTPLSSPNKDVASKAVTENDTVRIANDSLEYEIIIIDPGFGFAKTLEQNYELFRQMDNLQVIGLPMLVGISRKSMIYKLLDTTPEAALNGTTVLNTLALQKGAAILRVHDVREAVECIKILTLA